MNSTVGIDLDLQHAAMRMLDPILHYRLMCQRKPETKVCLLSDVHRASVSRTGRQ